MVAKWMSNIGSVYETARDYTSALEQFQSALAVAQEHDNRAGIAVGLSGIGHIYSDKNFGGYDPARSEEYLLRALELAAELGDKLLIYEIDQMIVEMYEREERWAEAHRHLRKYYELKSEVQSNEARKKAEQLEHQRQIAEMEKRRAIEQAEARELELRAQLLGSQLERKQQELASTAMHLARQTERLGAFRNDLRQIMRQSSEPMQIVKQFNQKLKELPSESIDWTKFEAEFQGTYPEFREKLEAQYPTLTKMEARICSLVKVRLTTPDIAQLLCVSERTVESHRLNIRKKMELEKGKELYDLLAEI